LLVGGLKSRIALLLLIIAGAGWYVADRVVVPSAEAANAAANPYSPKDEVRLAFQAKARDRRITAIGSVERILADDRDGSPHQRFIIRTSGGISLLIAHNLDLAPRLSGLNVGDAVTVVGEYVWNDKGGLMHWTHDDPQGRHAAGYIEWRGKRYQ
jgi:hypothetical protein